MFEAHIHVISMQTSHLTLKARKSVVVRSEFEAKKSLRS